MARLQILELPEGSGDDRPPFVLVVDEWEVDSLDTHAMLGDYWDSFGEKIGARGVLFVDRKIELPANDTSAYLRDSLPTDAHYETVIGGQPIEWTPVSDGQRLADERTDIARDMDRLTHRRDELADALGIDRGSNWDDIRNAAAGLRKSNEARGEAIDRVLGLPYQPEVMGAQYADPTGYQHGYRIAIQDAKRAVGHQSEHPTEKQARA